MGRRSMKTTKGGRFMNPTDQARKEARRKELKKNKKQRQMVREAVIKSKEPKELLKELEELEQQDMESSVNGLPNEKGIKERKRKLQDTIQRLQAYWEKESPTQYHELKQLVRESEERRRRLKQTYAFSSRATDPAEQRERLSLIPLPSDSVPSLCTDTLPEDIPLPEPDSLLPPAILKPSSSTASESPYPLPRHLIQERNRRLPRKPPGPPLGLPPALLKRQGLLGLTEIDLLNRSSEKKVSFAPISELISRQDETTDTDVQSTQSTIQYKAFQASLPPPASLLPPAALSTLIVPSAPPPLRSPFLLPVQSIPSSSLPPHPSAPLKSTGLEPHIQASAILNPSRHSSSDSAPTQIPYLPPNRPNSAVLPSNVISAKPQLRNTYAEVTRFVPTSIRVKREDSANNSVTGASGRPGGPFSTNLPSQQSYGLTYNEKQLKPVRTQDEAYSDFMKEMESLL